MDLATTVERIQQNFCICDPNLPDNPIVFASDGFLEMSRYDRFEVLGRNCRFMQVGGSLIKPAAFQAPWCTAAPCTHPARTLLNKHAANCKPGGAGPWSMLCSDARCDMQA